MRFVTGMAPTVRLGRRVHIKKKKEKFEFLPNVPQSYLQRRSLHNSEQFANFTSARELNAHPFGEQSTISFLLLFFFFLLAERILTSS